MKKKVHRIVLLVVDLDGIGQEEAISVLENNHYPNHCMAPRVMEIATADVEWHDGHPLNYEATQEAEYRRMLAEGWR